MTADLVDIGQEDVAVSFLPLSHITARHVDYLLFQRGVTIAYCPNFDDLPQTLTEGMRYCLWVCHGFTKRFITRFCKPQREQN